MEEVRQLVQEEGREARNLVAFHVAVDTPARVSRKPPRAAVPRHVPPRGPARLRSASAGRDKRSELRARYWALLFGDLQRAIGEIYNTVEAHENLNECQEVILVLENYTRDFKALGEWFRLKWEYDNTPPPQRPQSLAWEIRKTDFVRPESRRAYSVKSSPSVSGKNSPCFSGHNTPSGKNSPNLTGKASPGSGKISPRVSSGHSSTSPKGNIEFFSSKIVAKITAKPEPKIVKELSRLSDIKEKEIKDVLKDDDKSKERNDVETKDKDEKLGKAFKTIATVEIGKAKECANTCPKQVIIKSPKRSIAAAAAAEPKNVATEISNQAKATMSKLDAMENEFLKKHLTENAAKNDNILNQDKEVENPPKMTESKNVAKVVENTVAADDKGSNITESPVKSEDNFADVSNESSPKSDENTIATNEINAKEIKSVNDEIKNERATNAKESENPIEAGILKTTDDESRDENNKETVKETPKIKVETKPTEVRDDKKEQDSKKAETKPPEPKSRPAYSQAAAKPKPISTKTEVKTPARFTTLIRSKTVVEIRPNTAPKTQRQFPKRNQTSKCSYPFNLTTGRTSLFDSPAIKGTASKKPINRLQNVASGDSKVTINKTDLKKRPPRPTSLKINENGDKKENINPGLEKIKDCDEYSSSDTIVTQIDMSRIESSESLKTLVPDELLLMQDVANSIEVLNIDGSKNDDEGWLTVKSRRLSRESKKQSKSHWANRFHHPSATTSLPTLNMIESPKQETKSIINSAKTDRAKSEQPQNKSEKVVKVTVKPKTVSKGKNPAMIRQKSDVTGLKTRTSRNKVLKKEKVKDMSEDDGDLTRNRLHSSLESLTTGLSRSQESTEEAFDFDKWKDEFKTTFKYLDEDEQITDHDEILKAADPSEMSEIAEMTSQIEENERKISWALDFQSEVDQRKLCEEEDLLNRQIMELQQVSDIDLDTETDDTETDAEILCEGTSLARPMWAGDVDSVVGRPAAGTSGAAAVSLEDQYETALAGMSWAERVDTLGVLEALVARDPGRAQQVHAKLSQGIKRRGSFQDALRRLQAKQARAERQRQEYRTERARKIHHLLARVEEVKVAKNQLIEEKRLRMERRLQKAAENRDQHLKDIVRKAHDEEEKLREIAFIKQLEAENRRHDFLDQCRSHTKRLRQMRRERLDKLEQKAAREAAVGARRAALQAARALHVSSLVERRRLRDQRQQQLRQLRQQERGDAAREKAEGVKSRLSALAAAAELEAVALRSRIRDKQDASQQRLESHLQAIREKATGPRQPTTSESQDQSSKEEKELAEEAERLEQERKDREKQKAIKKKARKVKQKLMSTCNEALASEVTPELDIYTHSSSKLTKVLQQLNNIIAPLLDTENTIKKNELHQNGFNVEEHQITKKNKNKNNKNKVTNGDVNVEKSKDVNINENNNNREINDEIERNIKATEIVETNSKVDQVIVENDVKENGIKENKKRNKKKNKDHGDVKTNNERPKLSKASSVCSSLSDMSKTSCKSDKKPRLVIDMPFLERTLNELHRCMERFDKNVHDKATFRKVNGMKTLGNLLTVVAEREDLASQFTARCVTTAVVIISRAVAACSATAARFISTNTCVHVVKLLSEQLEKDLATDQKKMELAKQLSDCLSIALDSVLCAERLFEEKKEKTDEERRQLSALRNRAHTLISYLCLCGCVAHAEKAGVAREYVQTLLTVCADLCHPCDVDVGSERASATQSLRCALGTGVCGSRAEFCMLFAQGADLGQSGGFVRAARTAHLLRALAELDHQIVQESFGEGGWPLEFRAAVARLLSQHAPNDKEAPRTTTLRLSSQRLDQSLSETMVLDLIVLVGFVVVNNPQLQETICDGWSVIKTLCTLPANWLVSKPHSHVLLPTLVALTERPATAAVIAGELSMEMLDEYMESPEAQYVKLVQVIKQGRIKKIAGKK